MGLARIYILATALIFFFAVPEAPAQIVRNKDKVKVLLNAEFVERDNEKDITILRDNVQIILDENFISCKEAIIVWSKNEIIAVGDVLLKSPKSDVQADKIIYNFKDQKGRIFNGVVTSGQVLLQSEYIEKTGAESFKAENAYFTSCTTCPASWSFTADKVDATIEGYAYLSSPWFNILEIPFLYVPYLIIPLKNERQTGMLAPSFDVSSLGGAAIHLPYFWAINRSQDMTFGAKYYSKRGLQGLLNYRYRLSQNSGGEFDGAVLRDKANAYDDRWFMSYQHYLELPNDYIQRTNVHLTSDNFYTRDFSQQFKFAGEPALDNRTSLTKNFPDYHLSIDASYYMSLNENTVDESKENSVHRFPDIRFSITDKKILDVVPVFFRFDSQYVNFARQSLGYDTPFTTPGGKPGYHPVTTTGIFDPLNDKIRTGQRLDVMPKFSSPFRLFNNSVDLTPSVAYRHTQYVLGAINEGQNFDYFPHRNYLRLGLDASTELSAVYGSETKYRHSVVPEINFQSIPSFYQADHTFFGTQDQIPYYMQTQPLQNQDLDPGGRGLQFDYEDRIVGRRLVNLGITNKIVRKNPTLVGSQYTQTFLFSLSQAYDFIEAKKPDGLPWQDVRGILNVRWGVIDSFTETFHFPYHKVTNVSSRLRFNVTDANSFEVIYANYLNVPLRPVDVINDDRRESIILLTGLNSTYASMTGLVEYSLDQSEWTRWEAKTELIPPGRCWTISAAIDQSLDPGVGIDKKNVGFSAMINFKFGN